jgi:uncharacterized protein (TIGR00299 family) protein
MFPAMRVLFLDCFSGISGDMTVGALTDLGVSPSAFEWELSKLDLGDCHMHFERARRQHIEGVKFSLHEGATHREKPETEPRHANEHGHGHHHEHGHTCPCGHPPAPEHPGHAHGRNQAAIRALIENSRLSDFVKKHALSIFQRIAEAEGKIHGMPPEKVAFHEVGALDSIADIVLACAGIEALGVEKVFFSPLRDGRGWTETAHGRFPVPAPATLEILKGHTLGEIDEPHELITPTGAALAAEFGGGFGPMPEIKIEKIGYGVGSRELASRPNVLRAVLGELVSPASPRGGCETDTVTRLETNLDDLSPEITGAVMDKLFAAGALDVFFTPIQMKKNRPAVQLALLCEPADVDRLAGIIFAETSAFGLRAAPVARLKLERKFETLQTEFGEITVKLGFKNGELIQVAPEFESVRAAAEKSGRPLRVVYEAARRGRSA